MFDSDEEKTELKRLIAEAVKDETAGLKAKNGELLGDLKKARQGSAITPEQLSEVEDERDGLRTELAASKKAEKKAVDLAKTAADSLGTESSFTEKLLIDNGLVEQLTKNGITNPVHLKAAQAMLRGEVKIEIDGEDRVAKVGDKSLADHVKAWAESEEGKYFVAAPGSGGGGAPGGGSKLTNEELMKLPPAERMNAGRAQLEKESATN